jgi:hypothetical protein
MTKITQPGTTKDALDRAIGILSRKRAAAIIDKSESYLYELVNPDSSKSIRMEHAIELDIACLGVNGETPFYTSMRLALDAVGVDHAAEIPTELLKAQVSLGSLTKMAAMGRDGMTLVERKDAHEFGLQLIAEIEEILRALNYEKTASKAA